MHPGTIHPPPPLSRPRSAAVWAGTAGQDGIRGHNNQPATISSTRPFGASSAPKHTPNTTRSVLRPCSVRRTRFLCRTVTLWSIWMGRFRRREWTVPVLPPKRGTTRSGQPQTGTVKRTGLQTAPRLRPRSDGRGWKMGTGWTWRHKRPVLSHPSAVRHKPLILVVRSQMYRYMLLCHCFLSVLYL